MEFASRVVIPFRRLSDEVGRFVKHGNDLPVLSERRAAGFSAIMAGMAQVFCIFERGTALYGIRLGQPPESCIAWTYRAIVPPKSKLDLPDAAACLTAAEVVRWFGKQQGKKIQFDPDPWEAWSP